MGSSVGVGVGAVVRVGKGLGVGVCVAGGSVGCGVTVGSTLVGSVIVAVVPLPEQAQRTHTERMIVVIR